MRLITNDVYNFIYIAVIILGAVALTLTTILKTKNQAKQNSAIFLFTLVIFVYMVVDFVAYYYLGDERSGGIAFFMITLSDILFCMLVLAWINAIIIFLGIEDKVRMKWICIVSAVYLVSSQMLSILLGEYTASAIHVQNGAGKLVLQILNLSYAVIMISVGIWCIVLLMRNHRKVSGQKLNVTIVLLLIGYMIWIAFWDYNTWYRREDNLTEIYAADPLIMLYAIFNILCIYYFYKKDPLHIAAMGIDSQEAIELITEQYKLSGREAEVLKLINEGKSNKQIATELFISENTVKRHVNSILRKTKMSGRQELILKITQLTVD